jgi:hypothetical protein
MIELLIAAFGGLWMLLFLASLIVFGEITIFLLKHSHKRRTK